jgi:hypothetical protein
MLNPQTAAAAHLSYSPSVCYEHERVDADSGPFTGSPKLEKREI